jgi:hypothetical protein
MTRTLGEDARTADNFRCAQAQRVAVTLGDHFKLQQLLMRT